MNSALPRLLIVDDEEPLMRALCDTLEPAGYQTRGFTSGRAAAAALQEEPFDLLLTDLMMPEVDGVTLLRSCREIDPELACILMTGHGTIASAVEALKAGAFDYVLKPFKINDLLPAIARALATRAVQRENIQLREALSIHELARAISQGLEHRAVVERTLAAVARQSSVSAAYLLTPTDDETYLQLAGCSGPDAQTLDATTLALGVAGRRWIGDASRALAAQATDDECRVLSSHPFDRRIGLALPIAVGERLFGVLGFTSARAQRRVSAGQLKALDILARAAASAFATAALVQELRLLNEGLELRVTERTRELELANKDLEAFSYSVSHDLREPLRAVEGFCEMFCSEFGASVPEAGRKVLERIVGGANRMSRLINDLLHFSRFSREPLQRAPVSLRELTAEIVARLREPLRERPIEVTVGELPECFADRALLEQVVSNLVSNALKFTAGCAPARIEIGALRQGIETVYFVRDNGVGFDMRYAERLFGVFQRLHRQDDFPGTGVGLSIVHRIISRHGGRVWAESRPDQGATFFFTLPAPAVMASAPTAVGAPARSSGV
jgi:signal transduction histidine kinase/FixJ family two-component response regulator